MSDLKLALLGALKQKGLPEPVAAPPVAAAAPIGIAALPDPLQSEWVAAMRAQRVEIPAGATIGQLTSRSDVHAKELKGAGRARDAAALTQLKEQFLRERERRAWEMVKERFLALELNEKAYRALKQEGADPVKVLARLTSKKAEELRGMGAARVREVLLG
jgi:hypothetical protein